jgi:hypothetical protein
MIDLDTGGPFTAHTINQVPVMLVAPAGSTYTTVQMRSGGRLSDIAPTVLDLIGLRPAATNDRPKPNRTLNFRCQSTQGNIIVGDDIPWCNRGSSMMNKNRLWYRQPAQTWVEALPIGNGRTGGMVFGHINAEKIALNDDTFWSGAPRDGNHPDHQTHLAHIRTLLSNGEYRAAEAYTETHMIES